MDEKQFNQLMDILKEINEHEDSISQKLNILITPIFKKDGKKLLNFKQLSIRNMKEN